MSGRLRLARDIDCAVDYSVDLKISRATSYGRESGLKYPLPATCENPRSTAREHVSITTISTYGVQKFILSAT